MKVSLVTARRFTLLKQGFQTWPSPGKTQILDVIRKLGCVQIDTINVVERSHYLALWSRLGPYEKEHLDQLQYPDRKVFEFWAHAASVIPIEHYRYFMFSMKESRKTMKVRAERLLGQKAYLLDEVLEEIRSSGPMSSKDFKDERKAKKRQGWWDWKPAKIALEMLYNAGILMVAYRENFQRYYDLTENVLPSSVDTNEPSEEERRRFYIQKALDAWGIAKPMDLRSYYYGSSTRTRTKAFMESFQQLLKEEVLEEVTLKGVNEPYYILATDNGALQKVSEGEIAVLDGVTFISPFDNLIWDKNRVKELFSFEPKLEAYFPKEKRKFGYYTLNILYKDRFVGRLDPKMHRYRNILEVKSMNLENDFKPDTEFLEKLKEAFRSFMKFHKAEKMSAPFL